MISPEEYNQLKAFARQDALILGLMWIAGFASFVYITRIPALSFIFDMSIVATPIMMWWLLKRFRDKVIGGRISFGRGFIYLTTATFNALLLLTLCQWLYFQFLDHGMFFAGIKDLIVKPEYKAVWEAYDIDKKQLTELFDELGQARPIDIAMSLVSQSLFAVLIASTAIALMCKKEK